MTENKLERDKPASELDAAYHAYLTAELARLRQENARLRLSTIGREIELAFQLEKDRDADATGPAP